MRRLVTTRHNDFIIMYADNFDLDEKLFEYINEIYAFFEHSDLPMYVFLRGHTLILTAQEESAENELKLAGSFSRCQQPENPITYNIYGFDPDDDDDVSLEARINGNREKTQSQLSEALNRYFSDIRMISVPFDVVYAQI